MFTEKDIDDYQNRLTTEQKEVLLSHCNTYVVSPEICAWYDDMSDFYIDWVYDNEICEDENEADEVYEEGLGRGEFLRFSDGQIVRLVV